MTYTLTRQTRKTVGIYIKNGAVEVRAPHRVTRAEIDRFVAKKEKWIAEKLAASQRQTAQKQGFCVSYGSRLLWRGAELPLLGDGTAARIWRDELGFHLPPGMDEDDLKYNVIRLYKACAKNVLTGRVLHFAALMGVMPAAVKITEAKTRWGSCSKRVQPGGQPVYNLNFSWRLMLAEDGVIDAVVVHELAHIQEMNHSAAFYAVVRAVLPDYDARHAKLKLLSKRLGCEDWGF